MNEAIRKQIETVRDEAAVLLSGLPSTKEDAMARIDKMGNALMDAHDLLTGRTRTEELELREKKRAEEAQRADQQKQPSTVQTPSTQTEPATTIGLSAGLGDMQQEQVLQNKNPNQTGAPIEAAK